MSHPSDHDGPLPDIYRSREAFFSSLPAWRRFLAKLNWHPTIDLMVRRYSLEQADTSRSERSQQGCMEPTTAASEAPAAEPRQPSWRNAIKATLLLALGIGIAILLFSSPWFWLLLVAGMALWIVAGLLDGLWKTIYDTLQEGDQPAPP
jgi:hypothetical protein